jgi:hypothetical protein
MPLMIDFRHMERCWRASEAAPGPEKLELDSGIQQESSCIKTRKSSTDDGNSCSHWFCFGARHKALR